MLQEFRNDGVEDCCFAGGNGVGFSAKHYHFFTINSNSSKSAETDDLDYARLKGSSSTARLSTISIDIGYFFNKSMKISAEQRFYFRQTRYKYFDNISTNSTENRIKLTYIIY
jgi:hypothetical protein